MQIPDQPQPMHRQIRIHGDFFVHARDDPFRIAARGVWGILAAPTTVDVDRTLQGRGGVRGSMPLTSALDEQRGG